MHERGYRSNHPRNWRRSGKQPVRSRSSRVISVPWGPDGSLELTFPPDGPIAGADIEVVWPDLSGPLADYPAALEQALDSPVGTRIGSISMSARAQRWRSWWTTRRDGRRSARRCRSSCDGCMRRASAARM